MQIYNTSQYLSLSQIDTHFPTHLIVPNQEKIDIPEYSTAYGFIVSGTASLSFQNKEILLYPGMYFCLSGKASIENMTGFICIKENYSGIFTSGGPVEKKGRMKYIDGCSDTLLLSPLMYGDPCMNYLYVPAGISQTPHTHPSVRVGAILEGAGYCRTETERFELLPGNIFLLYPEEKHSFHTENNTLQIVVFHPESDFGPTHETHPMINRTYVDGLSLRGDNIYRTTNINE